MSTFESRITILNKNKAVHKLFKLGDNNTIYLDEEEFKVNALYDENNNKLLHLCSTATELSIDENINESNESNDENIKENYYFFDIVIDTEHGLLSGLSKVTYGYRKENSYMELFSSPVIPSELYDYINNSINTVYKNHITTEGFLSYCYEMNQDMESIINLLLTELQNTAPIKSKDIESVNINKLFNVCIVKEDNSVSNKFGDLLLEYVCYTKGLSVTSSLLSNVNFLSDDIDIFIIVALNDIESLVIPSSKVIIRVQPGLFSQSKGLLKQLKTIKESCDEKRLEDRKIKLEEHFKRMMQDSKQEGTGGCCGGKDKDGNCCGGSTEPKSPIKTGGCCGNNQNGCCGNNNEEKEKKEKKEEPVVKKACCGGKKKKQEVITVTSVEMVDVQPTVQQEVKKGCCKNKSQEECCKSSGTECSCTDCDNKC
jgi:hypothetical protein